MGGGVAMKVEPVKRVPKNVYFALQNAEGENVRYLIGDLPTLEEAKSAFADLKVVRKMLIPSLSDLEACNFIFDNPDAEDVIASLACDIFQSFAKNKKFLDFVQSKEDSGEPMNATKGTSKHEGGENWFMRLLRWLKKCVFKFTSYVSEMASWLARFCSDLFLAPKEKVAATTLSVLLTIMVVVLKWVNN